MKTMPNRKERREHKEASLPTPSVFIRVPPSPSATARRAEIEAASKRSEDGHPWLTSPRSLRSLRLTAFSIFACFACFVVNLHAAVYNPPPTSNAARLRAWSLLSTSAKQDALDETSNVTVSNITATGSLKLSGQTNEITDDGSQLLFNGSPIGVSGGDTVWTNSDRTTLTIVTNTIVLSDDPISQGIGPRLVADEDSNYRAIAAENYAPIENATNAAYQFYLGTYAIDGSSYGITTNGANIGVSGRAFGKARQNIGVAGVTFNDTSHSTTNTSMIGLFGGVATYASPGIYNGIVAEIMGDETADSESVPESAGILIDVRDSGFPIFVARTNNGTTVFSVAASGLATSAAGYKTATFTGITTTNTFYSVTSDLATTVTNVVVVQGGIITSWTVTP